MQILQDFSVPQLILITIRAIPFVLVLSIQLLFKKILPILGSCLPFDIWRRFADCFINLILTRLMLLILGYYRFDCENFHYFRRNSQKLILKSGFIGFGNHHNLIDFLYYSYLFNPVFVKLVITTKEFEGKDNSTREIEDKMFYTPLNYFEALGCAMTLRGFDPVVLRTEKEWKKYKARKMTMSSLVSECFEEHRGPIFILLPGLKINEIVRIEPNMAKDIFANEKRFCRSGVGFKVSFQQRGLFHETHKNQISFLAKLMSEVKLNTLHITSLTLRNFRHKYTEETYANFIDQNLYGNSKNSTVRYISYLKYLEEMDEEESKMNESKKFFQSGEPPQENDISKDKSD